MPRFLLGSKMNHFDQDQFYQFVIDNEIVHFLEQPIVMKSGIESHLYVNWRTITNDVFLLDKLTDHVLAFTSDLKLQPDCFYGVPEGATKVGLFSQYKLAQQSPTYARGSHVLAMGRGGLKIHGEEANRQFIGKPSGRTVVLEDVTTTGSSLITAVDSLQQAGVTVTAALGLTNRMLKAADGGTVESELLSRGVPYYSLSNAVDLLPRAYLALKPSDDIVSKVEEEFRLYGEREIKLK